MSSGPKISAEEGRLGLCGFCANKSDGIDSKPKVAKSLVARFITISKGRSGNSIDEQCNLLSCANCATNRRTINNK